MDAGTVWAMIDSALQGAFGGFGLHGPGFGLRAGILDDVTNLFFFYEIKEFINARIDRFAGKFLGRMMTIASGGALALMTLWVFWQGIRIMIGKSQESMMGLVMNSARAVFVLTLATAMASGSTPLLKVLVDGTNNKIHQFVTGKNVDDPYRAIDKSLGYMQVALVNDGPVTIWLDTAAVIRPLSRSVFSVALLSSDVSRRGPSSWLTPAHGAISRVNRPSSVARMARW